MKIKKNDFLTSMKLCLPGVEKGSSIIDGADTFVFKDKTIHSYNDSISVSVPFPFDESINGAVKSLDFFKLISKMPTDEIELSPDEGKFIIKSGTVEADMNFIQSAISEYISGLKILDLDWKPLPENFFSAVKLCKISCNNAPQRGIFVQRDEMMSTDISRINHHKLKSEMDRFWLDDPAIVEILKIDGLNRYCVSEAWVHFISDNGAIFSCKRKDDTAYPEQRIAEILKEHQKESGDVENKLPKGMYEVADRVSILSSELDGLPAIRMKISKDKIEFFAERTSGKIRETLPLEKPFENDIDMTLYIDPFFLIEAARKVEGFYLKEAEKDGKKLNTFVFYNDDYMQIASTFAGNQ